MAEEYTQGGSAIPSESIERVSELLRSIEPNVFDDPSSILELQSALDPVYIASLRHGEAMALWRAMKADAASPHAQIFWAALNMLKEAIEQNDSAYIANATNELDAAEIAWKANE
jgi:hypothetical protein